MTGYRTTEASPVNSDPTPKTRGKHAKPDDGRPLRSDADHEHEGPLGERLACPRCHPGSYARIRARHRLPGDARTPRQP